MNAEIRSAAVATTTADREIVLTRILDAPRDLVFEAWTDPQRIAQWWGPNGFTNTIHTMDVRPGGIWRFIMHGPDGVDYPNKIVYNEITKPSRLVYTHSSDEGDAPEQFQVTVTFAELGNKTKLTLHMLFATPAERDKTIEFGAVEGGNQTLERLAAHLAQRIPAKNYSLSLPSEREIVLTRVFDAPRTLVFDAFTKPEHVRRWWGHRDSTLSVCDIDLRPGGAYRFVIRKPDGSEYPFSGVFREIVPPKRLVYTFVFELMPDHGSLATLTFEEHDGKTKMTETILHQSVEDRDGHLQSGMEAGAAESMDRLAELLATLT